MGKSHSPVRCPARFYQLYQGQLRTPDVPRPNYEHAVPFVQMAIDHYLDAYYGCVEWVISRFSEQGGESLRDEFCLISTRT
ncbi:MAG: hypothetical protein P1S60_10300 [Anaerolineae bacterium]|nr:hypothetical protein [Anaerolineae bacterium]